MRCVLVNSNLKIVFCGILTSPFILQDLGLLQQYYSHITVIKFDIVNEKREGIFYFIWSLLTKDIFTIYNSDVVYIWFADIPAVIIILLAKIFGKKSIITIGGAEVVGYPEINYGFQLKKIRGFVARWCLKYATKVLIPSRAYKYIIKDLVHTSNVFVIPYAVDKLLWEHPLPIKSNKVVTALMTLQFTRLLKGIPTFESAAKQVPYECNVYEAMPHDMLMEKLREAKVYCQLSYTESFCISNLEAMACGCVPIVTNCSALSDMIGDTGLTVPYGDVNALVIAIQKAMTMDGGGARERSKLYSIERRIKALSIILETDYIEMPLVSVIIPSYNSAKWLPDTIGSILNQTYQNIEIIVVDDCSTDNTFEVVSKFKNVKYIKNDINMGECYTSCRGFEISNGDYICRLSSDDMYANLNKIKHQVEIMERTGVDWSYNSINCVGETLETAKTHQYFWLLMPTRYGHLILQLFDNYILKFPYLSFVRLFFGNPVNSSTLMFKRSSYMKSVKWSNGKQRTDCDGLLLYDLFLKRFKCIAIRELGSFYRIHPNQMTYASNYLQAMRDNKLEAINNVLNGDYPIWLKYMVKIIRMKL